MIQDINQAKRTPFHHETPPPDFIGTLAEDVGERAGVAVSGSVGASEAALTGLEGFGARSGGTGIVVCKTGAGPLIRRVGAKASASFPKALAHDPQDRFASVGDSPAPSALPAPLLVADQARAGAAAAGPGSTSTPP